MGRDKLATFPTCVANMQELDCVCVAVQFFFFPFCYDTKHNRGENSQTERGEITGVAA